MEDGDCEEVKKPKEVVEVKKEEGLVLGSGKEDLKLGSATSSRPTLMTSSGAKDAMPNSNHLTFFYGGRVYVFDSIPEEKVRDILLVATTAAAAAKSTDCKNETLGQPGTPILTRSPSLQSTACVLASPRAQLYPINNPSLCKFQADLPIARKHSLQRFFEKRRDRLVSKSPYATPTTETATPGIKLEASLDVGCFERTPAFNEEVNNKVTGNAA